MSVRRQIVGCGHPDRGDDAAGLLVVSRLNELGVPAVALLGTALSLIESWKEFDEVILIDAVVTGAEPGTIGAWSVSSETPLPADVGRMASTHGFGVAQTIALARNLDCLPPKLLIYGIEGSQFKVGAAPSAKVVEAIERLTEQIAH